MTETSERSRLVALVLSGTLGWAGAHRFYAGKIGTGLLMLFTGGGMGIWWFIDTIRVLLGSFEDAERRRIVQWLDGESNEALWDEIEALRDEVQELHERVDYSERLLTRSRAGDGTQ